MMTENGKNGAPDPSCPFCNIVAGGDTDNVVRRWDDCIAISPLRPATVGHTLLVPVVHVATIWDISKRTARSLAEHTLDVAAALRQATKLSGLNVIQSNGHDATQTVPHLHVHLVPRYSDDHMGEIWPEGPVVDKAKTQQAVRALSTALTELERP